MMKNPETKKFLIVGTERSKINTPTVSNVELCKVVKKFFGSKLLILKQRMIVNIQNEQK